MSVQPGPTEKRYAANGVTTIYAVPFLVIEAGDLKVYLNGVLLTSGYTHTGIGQPTSTLTFSVAPLGDLLLVLDVPFQRLVDYQENGDFLSSTVNRDFDRIWQALKQLIRNVGRALTLGPTDVDGQGAYLAKGNRISNLADPIDQQDAVTKNWAASYIDSVSGLINTTTGIAYDGGTLFDYLRFGVGRTVNSIAALKALSSLRNQRAFVLDYYGDWKGGGGEYYVDAADVTSADNGGTIIVAADGARWKMVLRGAVDVKQFGAKSDDAGGAGTDSYTAISKAITWAIGAKFGRLTAIGQFRISQTLVVNTGVFMQPLDLDGVDHTSVIRCDGVNQDVIKWSTNQFLRLCGLRNLQIIAGVTAGHGINIVYGATQCRFENLTVTALNPAKSPWIGLWNAFAVGVGGCFECIWENVDSYVTSAHTTYGMHFLTNGTCFNGNQMRNMRCNGAKNAPFIYIGNVHTTSYLVGNLFSGMNFENCPAGGMIMYAGRGTVIDQPQFWDAVQYTNHLLHFPTIAGLRQTNTVIRGFNRNGDTLAVGVRDILIAGADNTIIQGLTDASGSSYDWGGCSVVIDGPVLAAGTEVGIGNRAYKNSSTLRICFGGVTGASGSVTYGRNVASCVRLSAGAYRITPVAQGRADTFYQVAVTVNGTQAFFSPQVVKSLTSFDVTFIRFDSVAADPLSFDFEMVG